MQLMTTSILSSLHFINSNVHIDVSHSTIASSTFLTATATYHILGTSSCVVPLALVLLPGCLQTLTNTLGYLFLIYNNDAWMFSMTDLSQGMTLQNHNMYDAGNFDSIF